MIRRLLLALSLLLVPLTAFASPALPQFADLAAKLTPAVVNISTAKTIKHPGLPFGKPGDPRNEFFEEFFRHYFGNQLPPTQRQERALGTGFIISADGYILTNNHVVDGADQVKIRLADGRTFDGHIKGSDEKLDLALLKIDAKGKLPFAPLGDSSHLRVGDWVLAIGNPFGLGHTVTAGIISATGRVIGAGPYDDFIQTDASINPGNSGGPLINTNGEVIGINTAIIARGQGIGFAIPINVAHNVLQQLKVSGKVTRGWLGVQIQAVTDDLATSFGLKEPTGALVTDVVPGSPAAKAKLQRGDIILRVDGVEVKDHHELARMIADKAVGQKVKLQIFRNRHTRSVQVVIGRMGDKSNRPSIPASSQDKLGMTVAPIPADMAQSLGIADGKGVIIDSITANSPAADSNLQRGDIVLEINGITIDSLKQYRHIIDKLSKGSTIRLLIQRQGSLLYTTLNTN